jgi:Gram-negative bacterial TonB protein C-terminal
VAGTASVASRFPMSTRNRVSFSVALLATVGCGGGRPSADRSVKPARMAPPDPVVTCVEWVRRAVADPELAVERVPAPVAFDPPPIPKRLPKGVLDKQGHGEVRIRVLVDTMGVADMKTFTVVKSTHPTLTRSVRTAVAKWKFTPAEVSGCKVPRNYNWAAVAGGSKTAGT